MRIVHTADWHLGDRLGRIDRTDDLRAAVERIAAYCQSEQADVLLVAGDLFSELARPDGLREAIRHLQETFGRFLADGGTIVAITGNHDNENFCQTLWHAMTLASPTSPSNGQPAAPGRLHLATEPSLLRLRCRRTNIDVQFALMPFPTPNRYLDDPSSLRYSSLDEKNGQLSAAFAHRLQALIADPYFRRDLPSVLVAHITVAGGDPSPLFRLSPQEDIMLPIESVPDVFHYVALGHIHRPQFIGGRHHVRYSGSIERLDLGEQFDPRGVLLVELDATGLVGEPVTLPLPATPIYELNIVQPTAELPTLAERFPDAQRDLVNLHITYTAGVDNLEVVLRELDRIFPRWYSRDWQESSSLGPTLVGADSSRGKSFEETVRDYLAAELINHDDEERQAILERAEQLMQTD